MRLKGRQEAYAEGWRDFVFDPTGIGERISDQDLERAERGEVELETGYFHFGGPFTHALFRVKPVESSRPETSDPVRKATRKRVHAWINGERSTV